MSGKKEVILVVDDKPQILTVIADMLKEYYQPICVTSGATALRAITKHTPQMFILDIEMPEMNGYELAKRIRKEERFGSTPIIFLTGNDTPAGVAKAMFSGGNDYVLKPVEKNHLLAKIKRQLNQTE